MTDDKPDQRDMCPKCGSQEKAWMQRSPDGDSKCVCGFEGKHTEWISPKRVVDRAEALVKSSATESAPPSPLVGWMILEDYCEDMSQWDGVISFPDPTGANLAWENPIKMIEHKAYDALKAELADVCESFDEMQKLSQQSFQLGLDHCREQREQLKRDLASARAELAEAKAHLFEWEQGATGQIEKENALLKQQLSEMRECLEFYAMKRLYVNIGVASDLYDDSGAKARELLSKVEKK